MKTSFRHTIAIVTLLTAGQSLGLLAQETAAPNKPMGRAEAMHASLTAEVTAVNLATREVTLKGPQGNEVTVEAGPEVKRLDEVKVGDNVRVDYLVAVAAEVRPPTAEEAEHPLVIMDAGGRAPSESAPAGGVARQLKVVTTIEALNRPDQTVTVKGPMGNYLTARVADPERLTKVHIGDTVVIVYTEALAVSLEKVEKKTAE
jgi:L-ascorbate metabolism protein UlaG (beta-lactamase superfamily)